MKFTLSFELVNGDVAYALAIAADIDFGATHLAKEWIETRTKTEIKEIAKERVRLNGGESDYWPELNAELTFCARKRVDELWPRGV